jgi:small subunit ribosomal protein S17
VVQAERKVNRKTRSGTVVSSKNDQTVIVAVNRATRHRLYGKVIRQTKRYPVHDPENEATVGDLVVIEECRPISKTKHWRLVEVMTEREVAEVRPESIDEALVDEVQRSAARAVAEDSGEPGAAAAEAPAGVPAEEAPAPASEDVAADASPDAEQVDEQQTDEEQADS